MTEKIILASQSPRRKQLLEWAEISFEVLIDPTDESFPSDLPVNEVPAFNARCKALAVQKKTEGNRIILAADTMVVLNDKLIGKPKNRNDAISILSSLSAQKHVVVTGVILLKAEKEIVFSDATQVYFHPLSPNEIEFYVDKYKPYDKAGAYAIQEWIGVTGIQRIEGDFYNVMGLPISRVVKELKKLFG